MRRGWWIGAALAGLVAAAMGTPVAFGKPGDLIVAESDSGKILRIDPRTGHTSTVASGHGLQSPAGMTFAPNGKLFVADYSAPDGSGTIFKVDPRTHSVSPLAASSPLLQPVYVDYSPNGSLFAPDFDAPAIFRLSPTAGNPIALGGNSGTINPFGIEVDHDGSLVISDLPEGKLFRVDPVTGAAQGIPLATTISDPYGIDIDPKGRILVADESAQSTIDRVVPTNGAVKPLAAGGLLTDVTQPAVAPSGKVFVSAGDAGVVRIDPRSGLESLVAAANGGYFEGIEVEPPKCGGKDANVVGSNAADHLGGSRYPDVIASLAGRDVIRGKAGNDRLCGGGNGDRIRDARGRNRISCGAGGHDVVITNGKSRVAGSCETVDRR